jgi:glycerol-3-phosphate cytidylyltransferase
MNRKYPKGLRVGYEPGAYDLFHVGHLNIPKHAKSQCDNPIAGVVSDEKCQVAKGSLPVVPLVEGMPIVEAITFVDEVHADCVPDKVDVWRELGFDAIFKGDNWQGTPKGEQLQADFDAIGVEVCYFPYTIHTSSTPMRLTLETEVARG